MANRKEHLNKQSEDIIFIKDSIIALIELMTKVSEDVNEWKASKSVKKASTIQTKKAG